MATRKGRTCEVCGEKYDATYSAQRTCSRVCGAKVNGRNLNPPRGPRVRWPRTRVYIRECAQCGELFVGRIATVRVCSDRCRLARRVYYWARDKRRPSPDFVRRCQCGTEIERNRVKCDSCIEQNHRAMKQRSKRRSRARKRGAKSEPYTLTEIAERDKQRCGLCGRKVNLDLAVPHRMAPTIDHILPMADGGDDVRANVQLAHFICNSRKGTGGSQQLALVG